MENGLRGGGSDVIDSKLDIDHAAVRWLPSLFYLKVYTVENSRFEFERKGTGVYIVSGK